MAGTVTAAATDGPQAGRSSSYGEIMRSSAVIGGSTVLTIAVGIVRTKILALLLGPAGYGLLGAFTLIVDLARSVAQLGIQSSGVREVAAAAASGDGRRVDRTALVLRRAALGCAVAGAVALAWLAAPIARLSFGGDDHAGGIAWLGIAVALGVLTAAPAALLQGTRRIADLARIAVFGGLLGSIASVALIGVWGEAGIVPSLIAVAAASWAVSWWYGRRIGVAPVALTVRATLAESSALFRLGIAFMGSALLTVGAAYAVRVFVLRLHGVAAAGLFNAAWTLGGLYVGFILQALATDFYPRLVGVAEDDALVNRLVNEQARVSLLLALPGVLATLSFAPVVVSLFYDAAFAGCVETLRWVCLGMALRVLTWPLGYIVVAKNRRVLFLTIEVAWTGANVLLSWWLVSTLGLRGAGIAFFASYVFHAAVVYPAVRRVSGFRWSAPNLRLAGGCIVLTGGVFVGFEVLPPAAALALGAAVTFASAAGAMRTVLRLLPHRRLPRPMLRWLRLARS